MNNHVQRITALDIGTRSIVGVVMEKTHDNIKIMALETMEHQERAMMDGQIHDIQKVAQVVKRIKATLEKKISGPIDAVAVAAAGRALRTVKEQVGKVLEIDEVINQDKVLTLELEAVQKSQRKLLEQEEGRGFEYNCVGYSVINYKLNGHNIGNLVGQRGKEYSVEVLATFLPKEVVDSLIAVLEEANLKMSSITLEPIAASEVVIPPSMRRLNIALVDIGAGTSDIAISSDGSIVAYAMVPIAGDEITEALMETFLLDFTVAEEVKRKLNSGKDIKFVDILGMSNTLKATDIVENIVPQVKNLAAKIAEKIISLSPKPVQAVLCIGGGSLTPKIPELLADALGLSRQRVAIRGREVVSEVVGNTKKMVGPEVITPLGIGVSAIRGKKLGFGQVWMNGKSYRIFDLDQLKVSDALLAAGFDLKRYLPKPGMALSFTLNNRITIVKGATGEVGKIILNGMPAGLDTPVNNGDKINYVEAINGEDASAKLKDIVPKLQSKIVLVNEKNLNVNEIVTVNGKEVTLEEELEDLAEIRTFMPETVCEVLEAVGYNIDWNKHSVTLNGQIVNPTAQVWEGDQIKINQKEVVREKVIEETIDNLLPSKSFKIYVNGEEKTLDTNKDELIFVDIFNFVQFSPNPPTPGAELILEHNGIKANFTTPIRSSDRLTIKWKQKEGN